MQRNMNRKKELVRRIFTYFVMTMSIVIMLIFLMFNVLGYKFNVFTQEVQHNGLVQYASYPSGAMVSIDGDDLRRTQAKSVVLPGIHYFAMSLKGYETWQKKVDIKPETVTNLNYARLVPKDRQTTQVKSFGKGLQHALIYSHGNFLAMITNDSHQPTLVLGDLRDTNNEKFTEHKIDINILTGYDVSAENHTFSVSEWDQGGRYFIVKHEFSDTESKRHTQWLRFDREKPEDIIDITKIAGFSINKAHFIGTNGNELYVLQESGEVRSINLSSATISSPIISGVTQFDLYGTDGFSFVTIDNGQKVVGIWKKGWKKPFIVDRFDKNQLSLIRFSRYFNKDTVVVSNGGKVIIYRGEVSDDESKQAEFLRQKTTLSLEFHPEEISLNDSGRMIVFRAGPVANSYDLEHKTLSDKIDLGATQKINWLDDFHLWSVDNAGYLYLREFDGANLYRMMKADGNLSTALSSNQKYLYTINKTADGVVTLSKMNMTNGETGWWPFN